MNFPNLIIVLLFQVEGEGMENPCFEGESSPIKDRAPATVYTIERGPAQENRRNLRQSLRGHAAPPAPCLHKGCTGGWSLDLLPTSTTTGSSGPASRVSSLVAALLLATVITLSATAALLYTLRSGQCPYSVVDHLSVILINILQNLVSP